MIYDVVCIRDVKTGFLAPQLEPNLQSAIRNFEHAVLRNEDSLFFSHPEDYALYRVGGFDTDTGALSPELPVEVITAANVISAALSRRARSDSDGR